MKINQNQLTHSLQQLSTGYLISGDEPLLMQEASDQIRAAARAKGFSERLVFHADNNFDWLSLLDEANALSLFSNQRLLEVRLTSKPSDKGETFKKILAANNPDNILLVTSPRLDSSTQKTTWVKAFENQGVWLPIWPIDRPQYTQWLVQRCQASGLNINRNAVPLLAQQTEGNLLAAVQEIEKLKLLNLPEITENILQAAIADNARFDAFELSEMAIQGKIVESSRMLAGLKAEGMEPILILGALLHKIRQLITLKSYTEQQLSQAFKTLAIWPKQQAPFSTAHRHISVTQLHLALQKAEAIDNAVKGSGEDVWRLLNELLMLLAESYKLKPKHN